MQVVILLLHFRGDFVVRLREDALKRRDLRIVAERTKGEDLSHGFSGSYFDDGRNQ